MSISAEEHYNQINNKMVELVPELDTEWVRAPMANGLWKAPSDSLDNGTPLYIKSSVNAGIKKDYIWVPGNSNKSKKKTILPAGYYHFKTKEAHSYAYELVCSKKQQQQPNHKEGRRSTFLVSRRKNKDPLYMKVKELIKNRVLSDFPNDHHAARQRYTQKAYGAGAAKDFGRATYLPVLTSVFSAS